MLSVNQVRELFLRFFAEKDHKITASAPLVPHDDKSLLFINAGMAPLKEYFLGNNVPPYKRMTNCQMCMRAGGKHNDLDNVGFTARHHTFFEMLGNFSFGGYFKQQAIEYAWEFLLKHLAIPKEKLWITVFKDDQESFDIWKNIIKVSEDRIIPLGHESNFWQMGNTGPCGPCSEIFYDHGEQLFGGPPGSADEDGDRFVEIWNMVFMQYNRTANGEFLPLPMPCVDTGMGLERIAGVVQGVHDNYQTDVFVELLNRINTVARTRPVSGSVDEMAAKKVIADHIRASVFLVQNKVMPDNEGRGYVLRRIIRRALRFGYILGLEDGFFAPIAYTVAEQFKSSYPEMQTNIENIVSTLKREEESFTKTLTSGMNYLQQYFSQKHDARILDGDTLFKLYDTYGFPPDLTEIIAKENNYEVDYKGYQVCMQEQKDRSKRTAQFSDVKNVIANVADKLTTEFIGYTHNKHETSKILQLFDAEGKPVDEITDSSGMAIVDISPFYAESGGQVGDCGVISNKNGCMQVIDTQKSASAIVNIGKIKGRLCKDDIVIAETENNLRKKTTANHSATHLLHAALIKTLGDHVEQRGSLVSPDKLRFDFSHNSPLTQEQKQTISKYVNEQIQSNTPVKVTEMDCKEAIDMGAKALFAEKYSSKVRVLTMGKDAAGNNFSIELCGGTHVNNLADIGYFYITQESGLAAGIRRIEAFTGARAFAHLKENESLIQQIQKALQAKISSDILPKITQLVTQNAELSKQLQDLQHNELTDVVNSWRKDACKINNAHLLIKQLEGMERKNALAGIDRLKNSLDPCVVLLAIVNDNKVQLFAGVSKSLTKKISAHALVTHITPMLNGKGGGREDMAQGGGTELANLPQALSVAKAWAQTQLETK